MGLDGVRWDGMGFGRATTVAEAVGPPENAPRVLDAEGQRRGGVYWRGWGEGF
ncbi:unnamed protein product [Ectocarpus sp. CCAP 1310/34]|nr:unnamed protein product [Ectocarpus sp. CCAP 1310/34]